MQGEIVEGCFLRGDPASSLDPVRLVNLWARSLLLQPVYRVLEREDLLSLASAVLILHDATPRLVECFAGTRRLKHSYPSLSL